MRSILQSISYVEGSQKLLKGRLVKPRRHVLDLHSPSTFQEEPLRSAERCDPSTQYFPFISNTTINPKKHLNTRCLHLNPKGSKKLRHNFVRYLKGLTS